MKKINILLLVLGLFSTRCDFVELEENPPSLLSPDQFYTTESEFDAALTGAFRALYGDWDGTFDYADPLILTSGAEDVRSDVSIFAEFDRLSPNGTSSRLGNVWQKMYTSIANVNAIIGNLENAENVSEEALGQIEGQAKFLRAFNFFFLTRWFGEVQLTTFENQTNIEEVPQSSVADIYAAILSDLEDAESLLPVVMDQRGRPTRGAAKALMAKVYLTMGGWPLEEPSNYALARDKAAELISGDLAGIYSLESDFADLWTETNKSANTEFIFAFYGSKAGGGGESASHMHIASRHSSNDEGGWGDFFSEKRFYDVFPNGPRKDASFTAVFADGTFWEDAGVQPYIAKYRYAGDVFDEDGVIIEGNGEGFSVMLRYADVLLIYAEAANMAEGSPSSLALEAVNQVRRRAAGLDPVVPDAGVDLASGMSQDAFDDEVLAERNWELAFEHNRWFDLVRKKMVVEVNKDLHPNVSANNRYLPKPQAQLIEGILTQNEGY